MQHDYPVINADVLIIGGGSAGAMAAIRAKEVAPEQKVVIFEKGDIQYSGCIARGMDALNIVALPGHESPELYVESNSIACHGIMDEPALLHHGQAELGADAEADLPGGPLPAG